jgi:uncharacterized caspase-like protein
MARFLIMGLFYTRLLTSVSVAVLIAGCADSTPQVEKPQTTQTKQVDPKLEMNLQLLQAARDGNIDKATSLINSGADINYQRSDGTYPLYTFIADGYSKNNREDSLKFVKWMIEEEKADFHKTGFNGFTLIHASTDVSLTEYLVNLGLNINSLTSHNATTLMGSLANKSEFNENTSIQRYLIDHCVDLTQVATFGDKKFTALDFAQKFGHTYAYTMIKNAIDNPPIQCKNGGVLAPKLSFYNLPETFDSENVNINVNVEAQGYGVGDVVLMLNDTEIASNEDRALKIKRAGLSVKTFSIKLQNGLNELKVYAYDQSNKVKSEELVHDVVAKYAVNTQPKLYAVSVGIDQFKDSSFNLKYAEADATLFGSSLYKGSKSMFSEVHIDYMKKMEGTTKEAILSALENLKDISANDFFVFYAATHGVQIDGKYYLITSNVDSTDIESIKKEAISEEELKKAFSKIPTANKLLLFDTCYSGSVNEQIAKKLAQTTKNLNLTSITAANSKQTALEGFADGHGIFTYIVSDALDGEADTDGDGIVQSMELVNYVNKTVPVEAKKFNHIQIPAYFQGGQVFNITKLRTYKGPVDMHTQYYKPEEMKQVVTYLQNNDVQSLHKVIQQKKVETVATVQKIVENATKVEALNAEETLKRADKKFSFGTYSFVFNDNSIYLDIKNKIKDHFNFVDEKGRNLVVFDFYSDQRAPRVVRSLDTDKVSDIYMADRGNWFRVTLQTKSKQSYEYVANTDGVFIKLIDATK